jgi:hypothetical protein
METLLKVVALLSSGLFAGAALYVTAVEHPARMALGASIALQGFGPSYKRERLCRLHWRLFAFFAVWSSCS